MQARLIFTPGPIEDAAAHPDTRFYENGRKFECPRRGQCIYWATRDAEGKRATPQWLVGEIPPDAPYGMMIVDDLIEETLDPDVVVPIGQRIPTVEKLLNGHERVADLAGHWQMFGVVRIAGKLPTQSEIDRALAYRVETARNLAATEDQRYRRGTAGHKDGITMYSKASKAWAAIAQVKLPDSLEAKPTIAEMKPCKFCAEPILEAAIKCRYCGERQDADVVPAAARGNAERLRKEA